MNAIVSGRSGRALIIEGDSLKSFDVSDPSTIVPRQQSDLPYLFGEAADLRLLENTSLDSVKQELRDDRNFTLALDLALISVDAELPEDIREEALVELDELLDENKTLKQVESVLYAEKLPKTADLKGALKLCDLMTTIKSHNFLRRLRESQLRISAIRGAWESIPNEIFESSEYRNEFRAVAVREGIFRALVLGIPRALTVFEQAGLNPSIQKLPKHEQILREWQNRSKPLSTPSTLDAKTALKARIRALKEAHDKKIKGGELHIKRRVKRKRATDNQNEKVPSDS